MRRQYNLLLYFPTTKSTVVIVRSRLSCILHWLLWIALNWDCSYYLNVRFNMLLPPAFRLFFFFSLPNHWYSDALDWVIILKHSINSYVNLIGFVAHRVIAFHWRRELFNTPQFMLYNVIWAYSKRNVYNTQRHVLKSLILQISLIFCLITCF